MSNQNTSDLIEAYLKKFLEEQAAIEIRRAEMAHLFDCVPSQINYVINTRFTIQQGYNVISKRGGGGYIRIYEVEISDDLDQLEKLLELTEYPLTQAAAESMIDTLYEKEIVTLLEAKLMLTAVDGGNLNSNETTNELIRVQILRSMLMQLVAKEKTID